MLKFVLEYLFFDVILIEFEHCSVDECVAETDATDYNAQYKNLAKLVKGLESDFLARLDGGSGGSNLLGSSR